jgi:hypothetical protein
MARDSGGTYTLPTNSFAEPIAGTAISPTDAATTFADWTAEFTDSLSRTGKGGMSADLDMNNNDINEVKTVVFQGSTSGTSTLQSAAIAGTTTHTLPGTTATLVGKDTTDVLTNKTLDTAGTGNVFKINGVTISDKTGTGKAVLDTSPTIATPTLNQPNIVGTTTNNDAAAGSVGEELITRVLVGSAFGLTSNTITNVCSVSLTAGDWDVSGMAQFTGGATTTVTYLQGSISGTSATIDVTPGTRKFDLLQWGCGLQQR